MTSVITVDQGFFGKKLKKYYKATRYLVFKGLKYFLGFFDVEKDPKPCIFLFYDIFMPAGCINEFLRSKLSIIPPE